MSNPNWPKLSPEIVSLSGGAKLENSIIVCGTAYDIGVPVIHWFDKDGFDGYTHEEVEDRTTGKIKRGPRYGRRPNGVSDISQFVVHHSGGDGRTPSGMFQTLWRDRWLSVQFAIEDNGTVYQFLDAIELAWHAGAHNKISVGVECCLFPLVKQDPDYYSPSNCVKRGNQPHTVGQYIRHGTKYKSFEMPNQQVISLAALVAGTWTAFNLKPDKPTFPKADNVIPTTVIKNPLEHCGMIAHYHCTKNKVDPLGINLQELETTVANLCDVFRSIG